MTDRVKGFTVTLEHDIRIDDVEVIKQAIEMIRGVANVECSISNIDDIINQARIKNELKGKLWEVLK
jgi:hypothetical protein